MNPEPSRTAKRVFDILVSAIVLAVLIVPMLFVAMVVRVTSKGPALYWSDRIGRFNKIFRMPKFRTMRIGTPPLATHLLAEPGTYLTPVGPVLRKLSIDEFPQFWSVLRGDMSLVGPRPALYNQADLVALRTERGVHRLVPGITGWAQVNGRDDLPIPVKVEYDVEYLNRCSFFFDMEILWKTVVGVARVEGVKH